MLQGKEDINFCRKSQEMAYIYLITLRCISHLFIFLQAPILKLKFDITLIGERRRILLLSIYLLFMQLILIENCKY